MKVTIIEPNGTGGLIHFAWQMADALVDCGAEVKLVTGRDYELGHLPARFVVEPKMRLMPIFSPDAGDGRRRNGLVRQVRRVQRALMMIFAWIGLTLRLCRERPDAVIVSVLYFPFQALCLKAIALRGIRVIQVCHEIERRDVGRSWWERHVSSVILRIGYRAFHGIAFLAQSTEREFVAAFGNISRRVVLPHGPQMLFGVAPRSGGSIAAEYGALEGERIVLFFGLLRPSKGIEDLVTAFSMMPDRRGLRLVIAGYPTKTFDLAGLRAQVAKLGIAEATSLKAGYVPNEDVGPLLAAADVVVFPYRNATASGAVSAAQSLHRPVVATAVGGLREVIEDGVTGRLVAPGRPDLLAQAMADVLADPVAAQRMAEAGHEDLMRHRSWAVFARGLMDLLGNGSGTD